MGGAQLVYVLSCSFVLVPMGRSVVPTSSVISTQTVARCYVAHDMKESDTVSLSDDEAQASEKVVPTVRRTISRINPVGWSDNVDDIAMEDEVCEMSPREVERSLNPFPDARNHAHEHDFCARDDSCSGDSRCSSSSSDGTGTSNSDIYLDYTVYQKLIGQAERQCSTSSRWTAPILPNNLLISTIDKLTEMVERGLDVTNENGAQQMKGMLQFVLLPVMKNVFYDEPNMTLDHFKHTISCAYRLITLFVSKLKVSTSFEDVQPEFWEIIRTIFDRESKFYYRVMGHALNQAIAVIPGDFNSRLYNDLCKCTDRQFWYPTIIVWFAQCHGFEIFHRIVTNSITPNTHITVFHYMFHWLSGMYTTLTPSALRRIVHPYVHIVYDRLLSIPHDKYECDKIKGDVGSTCYITLYTFCKYYGIMSEALTKEEHQALDIFKLTILKCIITEAPFNTKMSALEELYRFLHVRDEQSRYRFVNTQIEGLGIVEALYKDNLHHVAYVDRVEKVLSEMLDRNMLGEDVLNIIWNSQKGKHEVIQRNVQQLAARLVCHFNEPLAGAFFQMLDQSWQTGDLREKSVIVDLLKRVGLDQANAGILTRVLEFLWRQSRSIDCMNNEDVQARIVEVVYEVLDEVFNLGAGKHELVVVYIMHCVEDVCSGLADNALIVQSLLLLKRLIKLFPEKAARSRMILRVDVIRDIENKVLNVTGASFCHAVARNISDFVQTSRQSENLQCIRMRFEFLKFYFIEWAKDADGGSEPEWVNDLWVALIESQFVHLKDIAFRFFTDLFKNPNVPVFCDTNTLRSFFHEKVLKLPASSLSVAGFQCFEIFIKNTNLAVGLLKSKDNVQEDSDRQHYLVGDSIEGEEYLWELITVGSTEVYPLATNLYVNIFSSTNRYQSIQSSQSVAREIVRKCMHVLLSEEEKEVRRSSQGLRQVLQAIIDLVETNERDFRLCWRKRPTLKRAIAGRGFMVVVQFKPDDMARLYNKTIPPLSLGNSQAFQVHENMLLNDFIDKICQNIMNRGGTIYPYALSLVLKLPNGNNHRLSVSDWGSTLRELGIDSTSSLLAKPEKTKIGLDGTSDDSYISQTSKQHCLERETTLFSVVLANDDDVVSRIVDMAENPELAEQCFNLLGNIPIPKSYANMEDLQEFVDRIPCETSPHKQVYDLMILNQIVMPSSIPVHLASNYQLRFLRAGGIQMCLNLFLSNTFDQNETILKTLGYSLLIKLFSFSLILISSFQEVKDVEAFATLRLVSEEMVKNVDYCFKEFSNRIVSICRADIRESTCQTVISNLKMSINKLLAVMKKVVEITSKISRNRLICEGIDFECPSEIDEGELMVLGASQIFAYLAVFNMESAQYVLTSEEFYSYVNETFVEDRRLAASWKIDAIVCLMKAAGPGSEVCVKLIDKLFMSLEFSDSTFFWELLVRIIAACTMANFTINYLAIRLEQTIKWLIDVQKICQEQQCSYMDDVPLCGRLKLCNVLIEQVSPEDKERIGVAENGYKLIELLINYFILPSSRAYSLQNSEDFPRSQTASEMHTASSSSMFDLHAHTNIPRSNSAYPLPHRCIAVCGSDESQRLAYMVVYQLCDRSEACLNLVKNLLMDMFYKNRKLDHITWEYQPDHSLREAGNYVGLKNGGATCYMNSILQQLFMLPAVRSALLNVDPASSSASVEPAKLDEIMTSYPVKAMMALQSVFAHLVGYELDAYTPSEFWSVFKMSKNLLALNEQQDALEFYNAVVDLLDESMKMLGIEKVCEKTFGGLFADEKICKDCPHRYSREEPFTSISIDVQAHNNLEGSLKEYVLGDVLENDNAYYCEKCEKKVTAVKRLTIQRLPPILVMQLKRFEFDWEKEAPVKFNDYFEFPFDLDMRPYTAEAAAKADNMENGEESTNDDEMSSDCMYRLRGVVVHSGQATGGHYYSFIKSSDDQKWYKFDDTDVSHYECDLKDVKNKWYGGDTIDDSNRKKRSRCWWNAYLLFYEKVVNTSPLASPNTVMSGRNSAESPTLNSVPLCTPLTVDSSFSVVSSRRSSTSSPVTRLHKHFSTMSLSSKMRNMPPRLEAMVRRQNTRIMHERNQYNTNFFTFIRDLVRRVTQVYGKEDSPEKERCFEHATELFSNFMIYTCLHSSGDLRNGEGNFFTGWCPLHDILMTVASCRQRFAAQFMLNENITKVYLLDAKEIDVRVMYGKMVFRVLSMTYEKKDTIGALRKYNSNNISRLLYSLHHQRYSDNDLAIKLMLDAINQLAFYDNDRRGVDVIMVLIPFSQDPYPKYDLYCMMVRQKTLHLLQRIMDNQAIQILNHYHNLGLFMYIQLYFSLLRVIDLRPFLSSKLGHNSELPYPCPYLLVPPMEAVQVKEVPNNIDINQFLFMPRSYSLLYTILSFYASTDHRLRQFIKESMMFFCWNNEFFTAHLYNYLIKCLLDDRNPQDHQVEIALLLFADIVSLKDEYTVSGHWLAYLLQNTDAYKPADPGMFAIFADVSKQRQENIARALVILLERYLEYPELIKGYQILPYITDMYSTLATRYSSDDEMLDEQDQFVIPHRFDIVRRLGGLIQNITAIHEDSDGSNSPLDLSVSGSSRTTMTTPQSGDKRPFPDDDSPCSRRDSKKFNDGSEIPRVAAMDDQEQELLLATSRSADEQRGENSVAPPPAYDSSSF